MCLNLYLIIFRLTGKGRAYSSHTLLLFSILMAWACHSPTNQQISKTETVDRNGLNPGVPTITFENLLEKELPLSPEAKQFTVLHFWATWCKPCLAEFPELSHSLPRLASDSVQFFFASDEELAEIKLFENKYKTGLDLVRLKQGSLADFEIYALPTTIVLNRKGEEVFRHAGQLPWSAYASIDELVSKIP